MAEYLKIQNFGPINHVELKDIKQLLILVGESASGKSTILKVLSMCRWIFKQQNIRCYLHSAGIARSPFSHSVNTYLESSGLLDSMKPNTFIHFKRDDVDITIRAKDPFTPNTPATLEVTEPLQDEWSLEKICFITEKRNNLPDLLANRAKEKFAGYYLRELYEEFTVAKKHIQEMNIASVDVRLRLNKNKGFESWMIESDNDELQHYSIHLEDASSGIQSSAALEMLLAYYTKHFDIESSMNNAVLKYLAGEDDLKYFRPIQNVGDAHKKCVDIHIEEPEMCLYPSNQINLMNTLLASTLMDEHSYVVRTAITTHSPYLLNYLNLLFKAFDKNVNVSGVNLDFESVDVYAVTDGTIKDLKLRNAHLIDPEFLSGPIDEIYNQYEQIEKMQK